MAKDIKRVTYPIDRLKDEIKVCFQARLPVMLHGHPGCGKSAAVKQIAEESGRPLVDFRLSMRNPVDVLGVPGEEGGRMVWFPPKSLPLKGDKKLENAILFLDEINACPRALQVAAYQLVFDRRTGDAELADGVDIIAAGNLIDDLAVTYEMSSALRNRFVHYEVEVSLSAWKKWALKNGIKEEVIAYLSYQPKYLYFFDKKVHVYQFPTPRSWEFVSRLLSVDPSAKEAERFVPCLGESVAIQFAGFMRVYNKIPNAEAVVSGDMSVKCPTKPDELFAFGGALVGAATSCENVLQGMRNMVRYATEQMPAEFATYAVKDLLKTPAFNDHWDELVKSEEWAAFGKKYQAATMV